MIAMDIFLFFKQIGQTQKKGQAQDKVDHQSRTAATVFSTKPCFNYKIFYESPWLLSLVSSIRRRANRRRIADEAYRPRSSINHRCHRKIKTSYCYSNDSFFGVFRAIHRQAIDRCWVQKSWTAGSKRLEALSKIRIHRNRTLISRGIQNGVSTSKSNSTSKTAALSLIHRREGGFASPCMCTAALGFQTIRSDALVVFSGNGATDSDTHNGDGDDGNQHQLVLAKKEDASFSSSKKLWETAILTAAAICIYKQQQQQQQQEKEQALPHETPQEDEGNHVYALGSFHGKDSNWEKPVRSPRFLRTREIRASSNHGYKHEIERQHKPPTSGKEHDCIDNFEDNRQRHQHHHNRQQQQLRSKCVEKTVVLKSYHRRSEDCVGRNEKKRPHSPSQREEDGFAPPSSKRPRDDERLNKKVVHDGFEMTHDKDALKKTLRDPSSSKQKQPPNQKEQKIEKCKSKELMLLQRFGLSSSKKNPNDSEVSVTIPTKSNCMHDNDDSTTQVHKDVTVGTPSVFHDTQSQESEDDDGRGGKGNGDITECLPENTDSEEHVPVDSVLDYSSPIEFPVCSDYYDEEEDEEKEDVDVDGNICTPFEKHVQSSVYTANTAYPASHSFVQKKIERKRKRRRTSEEKRRRKERKQKRDSHRKRWDPDDFECDVGDDKGEGDRLESPKKIDLKDIFTGDSGNKNFTGDSGNEKEEGEKLETPRKLEYRDFDACVSGSEKEEVDKLGTPKKLDFKEICKDGGDENEERNKLETPKKLDFRNFSPAEALGNERDSDGVIHASDQNENIFHSSNAVIRMPAKNCDRNDEFLKSPRRLEDDIAPDDPFSVTSEDILLATITCPDAAVHRQQQAQIIHLLCSEIFLENFGEVIAEIVRSDNSLVGMPIRVIDTDLVDVCGVDIEMPSRGAMVVSKLSQIQFSSGGLMGAFLPKIVELAATNRYRNLFVFLCVDVELDSEAARDLVRLQTAFLFGERGMSMTQTSFQWSSKRSLGACIVQTIELSANSIGDFSSSALPNIDHWLSDPRTCQRLKFLLSIIPTLSLTGALHWLELSIGDPVSYRSPNRLPTQHSPTEEEEDESSEWFQRCFKHVNEESSRLESCLLRSNPKNSESSNTGLWNSMNPSVPKQLVCVVGARLNEI